MLGAMHEAIRQLRTALAVEPKNPFALWYLGFALVGAEQFDEASRTLEKAAALSDRNSAVLGVLVRSYARSGRRAEAFRVLDELHRRRQRGYVPPVAFVNAYLGLGDKVEHLRGWSVPPRNDRASYSSLKYTSVLRFDTRRPAVCGVSPPRELLT
jgi:pentatricopeptide repeat protein